MVETILFALPRGHRAKRLYVDLHRPQLTVDDATSTVAGTAGASGRFSTAGHEQWRSSQIRFVSEPLRLALTREIPWLLGLRTVCDQQAARCRAQHG